MSKVKKVKRIKFYDIVVSTICILLAIATVIPFYNVAIRAVASPAAIAKQTFYLIPTSFDISAFRMLFEDGKLVIAFGVSLFVTMSGTAISILVTTIGAYALSKKTMPGKNVFMLLIVFTMFFGGGLIPYYLNIKSFGMINKMSVLIVPGMVNTFYLLIMINYFRSVPKSLEESAKMDGASVVRTLFAIILPISKPTMAAITLFYAVDRWNEWWHALLFISDTSKYPMQLYLREMLADVTRMITDTKAASMTSSMQDITPDGLKMATVIVTMVPVMIIYPFLQKHFAAGIMLGSIKE